MLLFVKEKIINKKWLNLCLLVGIILLTAVFSCYPMMAEGAGNQLLRYAFNSSIEENGKFPATVSRTSALAVEDVDHAIAYVEKQEQGWISALGIPAVISQKVLSLEPLEVSMELSRDHHYFRPTYVVDGESHIDIVKGVGLEEAGDLGENVYPCLISEYTMDCYDMAVGEKIALRKTTLNGEEFSFVVVGIFREAEDGSNFWYDGTKTRERALYVSRDFLQALWADGYTDSIQYDVNLMMDYTYITYGKVDRMVTYLEAEEAAGSKTEYSFASILTSYKEEVKSILTVLWVLALPCVVLLILFIYMVSSQILSSEEGEIAVMRSRGMTRPQIVLLYLLQSLILTAVGGAIGILLGFGIGKLAAHMDGFMVFAAKDTRCYQFTWSMVLYALLGGAVAILFMTIPVFGRARLTIVQQKSTQKYVKKTVFWERFFLDLILMALSLYLLYNYNRQLLQLASDVASGAGLDPVLFLNVSLFILAGALLSTRLIRYLLLLVDKLGKKRWKPAAYASFLELNRNYGSRIFISVFLIMTIACGIFNADMARTINQNTEDRINYNVGADVVFREKWKLVTVDSDSGSSWYYQEPNIYNNYQTLIDQGLVASMTRVMGDKKGIVNGNSGKVEGVQWMAINTKEFGETAELADGLNEEHWFYALNALAAERNGLIISRNLAAKLGVAVGDTIRFSRNSPDASYANQSIGTIRGTVVAIVDAFPSYDCYSYSFDENGELVQSDNYLLVCNYAAAIETFTLTPYNVWVKLAEQATQEELHNAIGDMEIKLSSFTSQEEELEENRNSAIIQSTNGMFTISFLISLAVCAIGFLIYWIMSLQSRELLFGIYRAMGLRMKELRQMLLIEQLFGSILPIAAGGICGFAATKLFTRLLATVYLPEDHTIALRICIDAADMLELTVIIAVMVVVCFLVLREILRRMNIVQALKLGED